MTLVCEEDLGGCPKCGGSIVLSDGPQHWGHCWDHKTKWYIGRNLFSVWGDLSEEQHQDVRELLSACQEVEPLSLNEPIPGAAEAAALAADVLRKATGGAV
ncbi:hypothetical protein [Rhizobium sp. BK251]|uniref:hypothetical protein n=1 Tax=Rhizobium sp. BK251 TaxID=2512125 RepID=UPI00104CD8F6|nr:hypothetical protein [Rhizobium sp. BK251]TCL70558.1 hypothetical protein EV286_107433 [Rhizobium sp. BK251]